MNGDNKGFVENFTFSWLKLILVPLSFSMIKESYGQKALNAIEKSTILAQIIEAKEKADSFKADLKNRLD